MGADIAAKHLAIVPTSRLTEGFCDFSASSIVFEPTPSFFLRQEERS